MTEPSTFLLIEIYDGLEINSTWTFRAVSQLDIARFLCRYWYQYRSVFDGLDISPKEAMTFQAEELLKMILDSPYANRHNSVFYLLRVPEQAIEIPPCAEPPSAVRNGTATSEAASPESAHASRG